MKLRSRDEVMSMDVVSGGNISFDVKSTNRGPDMLIVLENGFGKRTMLKNFHLQKRGGMGIRAANCTPKTGNVIGMHIAYSDLGDVILASRKGQFIRMELAKIKRLGRDTQGVTLMKLRDGDKVSSVALILPDEIQDEPMTDKDSPVTPKSDAPKTSNKPIPLKQEKEQIDIENDKLSKAVETNDSEIKVHYYGAKEADGKNVKEQTEIKKDNVNVQFYNKESEEKKDQESNKPKNPPIVKDEENYWGK